jgi:hypothetical protein
MAKVNSKGWIKPDDPMISPAYKLLLGYHFVKPAPQPEEGVEGLPSQPSAAPIPAPAEPEPGLEQSDALLGSLPSIRRTE